MADQVSGPSPLPAVLEAEATGETQWIFADLRTTLDVPFVNLIWRHLATIPGMLPWTWSVVKPLHNSAELQEAVAELAGSVGTPPDLRLPTPVLDAVGLTPADRAAITALVRHYNRANAMNLLTLLVARSLLQGHAAAPRRHPASARPDLSPASDGPTLALPGLATLPSSLQALILRLDQFGRTAPSSAVASLYTHLSHWPGFLGLLYATFRPAHESGDLVARHAATLRRGEALATHRLLPVVHADSPPPEPERSLGKAGIDQFTTQMIARMLMMGTAILSMMPQSEDGPSS